MSAAGEIELRKRGRPPVGDGTEAVALRNASAAAKPEKGVVSRPKPRSRLPIALLIVVLVGWGLGASWFAYDSWSRAQASLDVQAELRSEFEAYRIAIGRRLAGVGASQNLEQDGLLGRLADMVARQEKLESRQGALIGLAERLSGVVATGREGAAATAAPADPAGAAARGAPPPTAPAPRPGQRSSLEPPGAVPGTPAPPAVAEARPRLPAAFARLTTRQQFDQIEGGIRRLEANQTRVLTAFRGAVQAAIDLIRNAVTEVGLKVDAEKPAAVAAAPRPAPGRRPLAAPDTFDADVAVLDVRFADLERLRKVADAVPFRSPLGFGGVTSNFGTRKDPFTGAAKMHAGMDFRSPIGTPIRAGGDGRVITAGETGGYGNLVEIDHGNSVITRYGHMSAFNVAVGQTVAGGAVIGAVGSTGRSTGPHLHYETRINGSAVDPGNFIRVGGIIYETPKGEDTPEGEEMSHD